jgi:hypothetical protein
MGRFYDWIIRHNDDRANVIRVTEWSYDQVVRGEGRRRTLFMTMENYDNIAFPEGYFLPI